MENRKFRTMTTGLLLCGVLGCLLMGGSDWLMIYGDPAYEGSLSWLTLGAARIPAWRNSLAMLLAFPAVVLYAAALLGISHLLKKHQKSYCVLTTIGMLPWLCLHLFYSMILFLFGWLSGNGYEAVAFSASEALFQQFVWLVPVGELLMLLPFFYLFYLMVSGQSLFPRWMALNNPLLLYVLLKLLTQLWPVSAVRLAFINGLMSESMLLWFLILLLGRQKKSES